MASRPSPAHPPVPEALIDSAGMPRFGSFAGELSRTDLSRLGPAHQLSRVNRLFREKKWAYVLFSTSEVVALAAIVDLGYTANAFVTVVDLHRRMRLFDESFLQGPGPLAQVNDCPGPGLEARFRSPGVSFRISRGVNDDRYRVSLEVSRLRHPLSGGLTLEGEVLARGQAPALTVVAPVEREGKLNVTQKSATLLGSGTLTAGGRRFSLDGSVAGFDYTHGYLARETAWRWAFAQGRLADGTPIGLNLVEGFNELHEAANENALWVGEKLHPLSRARFSFNRSDIYDRWSLTTDDGEVELEFHPIHAHHERRDLVVVKSRFVQPVGLFRGHVKVQGERYPFERVPGVTEDQEILW